MAIGVFDREKSVFFVMDESGASGNVGGCTQAWWNAAVIDVGAVTALAKLMNPATGAPIIDMTDVVYDDSDDTLTKTDIHVGVEVGMVAFVRGSGLNAGRFKITDVGTDWIECDSILGTSFGEAVVTVGGAFDELQEALDETDATDHSVTIYVQSMPVTNDTITVDFGGGSNTNNTWKRIVGFNTVPGDQNYGGEFYESAAEMMQNDQINLTKTVLINHNAANSDILNIDEDNIVFENFYFFNAPGYEAILFSNTPTNIIFRNCRFTHVDRVCLSIADNLLFDSCYSITDFDCYYILSGIVQVTLLNCVGLPTTGAFFRIHGSKGNMIGCVAIGGLRGIRAVLAGTTVFAMNNTFYGQTAAGIFVANNAEGVYIYNNIFMLAPGAFALYPSVGGSVENDYNCFIETDSSPLTVGAHETGGEIPVTGPHGIETDPLFIDAANNDFRLRPESPCLNTGNGENMNMGAWQRISRIRR